MDELISRFPDIAEDIFNELGDETLAKCKEASRLMSSFLNEDIKFWIRIIMKLRKCIEDFQSNENKQLWGILVDMKKTRKDMIKELGQV